MSGQLLMRRVLGPGIVITCWFAIVSCSRDTPSVSNGSDSPSPDSNGTRTIQAAASSSPATATLGVHQPSELVEAATEVIRFLRGEVAFDRIQVADTVTLYLGPEEGGTRSKVTRETLRNPSNWKVSSPGLRSVYSFAPPKGRAILTTSVGRHFHCGEHQLSSIFEELAQLPHVGTMLKYGTASCLQTWNLTIVFDPDEKPPKVIAAVYDQYEW